MFSLGYNIWEAFNDLKVEVAATLASLTHFKIYLLS